MVKKTQEQFIEEAKKIHGDTYDYSLSKYNGNNKKIKIVCNLHGVFEQSPIKHINAKHGCPKCGKLNMADKQKKTQEQFIEEAKKIHGDTYDYSLSNYVSYREKVTLICPIHGVFEQIASNHLKGKGCKYCGGTSKMDNNMFIFKSKKIHGDTYDYKKTDYQIGRDKVVITCPIHGDFECFPSNHLSKKRGCPHCTLRVFDTPSFIERSKILFNDKFTYEKTLYNGIFGECIINCVEHGEIKVTPNYHFNSECGCKLCCNSYSKSQIEIKEYIETFGFEVIFNSRDLLKKNELDLYVPEKKLAIEFNGLYWHSDKFKDKKYHLNKTIECEKLGIKLLHIFEDEWEEKKEIIKSIIKHKLGVTDNIIYARKCEVKLITSKLSNCFLEKNHIQGVTNAKYKIGLFYKEELVSLLTIGKRGILKNNEYEIIRFCNKINTSVIGSFSKLLKHFIKETGIENLITYSDRRFSTGELYLKNGFSFLQDTEVNYYYILNKKRENRFKYQKHKLVEMGYDKNKTESEILSEIGLDKIYDCGSKKFFYISNSTKSADCKAETVTK